MNVLGLSFDYHDSAAALLVDGRVVAAAQEERFTRVKQTPDFPAQAVAFCLEAAGLAPAELDAVAYYEQPLLKLDRILKMHLRAGADGPERFTATLGRWLAQGRLDMAGRVAAAGLPPERLRLVEHHQSHAASAFFCSPFDSAAVLTIDGVGEHETATISRGRGAQLEKLSSVRFPHSLGLFYSAFTAFLGFEVNEGEYKVMGMAAFGRPVLADELLRLFALRPDGSFRLDQRLFDFSGSEQKPYAAALIDWLGPARQPDAPFDPAASATDRRYADIAASVQACAEAVILHMARAALARAGEANLCLSGGVALNSVANGRIRREIGCPLYVQPAAGDGGGALGAALYCAHAVLGQPRAAVFADPYQGRAHSPESMARTALMSGFPAQAFGDEAALLEAVAERLAQGRVVGWLQGRAEWGPRALGNRSILASPLGADMQLRVNEKIKFREPFRPFAPSVLAERAHEYFDFPEADAPWGPEHFMLSVCPVREDAKALLPAVTHADGSARLHLVRREMNPRYHGLIEAFGRKTGVPVLLNTSFNLRGQPIVDSPADALATFLSSGIDTLVLGDQVVDK